MLSQNHALSASMSYKTEINHDDDDEEYTIEFF